MHFKETSDKHCEEEIKKNATRAKQFLSKKNSLIDHIVEKITDSYYSCDSSSSDSGSHRDSGISETSSPDITGSPSRIFTIKRSESPTSLSSGISESSDEVLDDLKKTSEVQVQNIDNEKKTSQDSCVDYTGFNLSSSIISGETLDSSNYCENFQNINASSSSICNNENANQSQVSIINSNSLNVTGLAKQVDVLKNIDFGRGLKNLNLSELRKIPVAAIGIPLSVARRNKSKLSRDANTRPRSTTAWRKRDVNKDNKMTTPLAKLRRKDWYSHCFCFSAPEPPQIEHVVSERHPPTLASLLQQPTNNASSSSNLLLHATSSSNGIVMLRIYRRPVNVVQLLFCIYCVHIM